MVKRPPRPGVWRYGETLGGHLGPQRKVGEDAKVDARRIEVAALLLEGLSLSEIAARTGVSKTQSHRDVEAIRQDWRGEARTSIQEHIESQLGELAGLKDAIRADALNPESDKQLAAIDRMVKLLEREARLLGLDGPTRTDVTSAGKPLGVAMLTGLSDDDLKRIADGG